MEALGTYEMRLPTPTCDAACPTPMFQVGAVQVIRVLCTKERGHDGQHGYIQEWENTGDDSPWADRGA